MLIRTSSYVHLTPLGEDRVLVVHAITHFRLVVDQEVGRLIAWFEEPRSMPGDLQALPDRVGQNRETLPGCLAALMERGVLVDLDPEAERAKVTVRLNELHGRDPGEALDRLRRESKAGAEPYWAVSEAIGVRGLGETYKARWQVLLFGDCELQMEADFLRRAGADRGVEILIATGFPGDLRLAAERPHDAVLIGALRSRRMVALAEKRDHQGDPGQLYLAEAKAVIEGIRHHSQAPILIDNLPEPTVQPLGFADRGPQGHRNRFRRLNLDLDALASVYADVFVVDIAAALNGAGAQVRLDDGLVGFTHFGSPGWMLQRPKSELAAVHDRFPDLEPLRSALGGDPYGREIITAKAHMDALSVMMGFERKKCVILDLDGTLWPGVLAETGSPFAWTPEVSGVYSYVGLYFGLHEALKALKARGVVLACVSKNDEAVVRELWRYPDHYPLERLLTLDDFVTTRINWSDKASNIASIAAELGFAADAFVFIDDHPVERDQVRSALPDIWVLGEDPFALRRILLDDPRLQAPRVTKEASMRTELVKSQLHRDRERQTAPTPQSFLNALDLVCSFDRPRNGPLLERVQELLQRTTQFNTTGIGFSQAALAAHASAKRLFIGYAKDRFGDYGLVAAAVVEAGEIVALVMSCRVIGLGVDVKFLAYILGEMDDAGQDVTARIIETSRNGPVRHLYFDNGFSLDGSLWRRSARRLRQKA